MQKCEYCDKEFKTLSSLNYHKKTAKYCLLKRGNVEEQKEAKDEVFFNCIYCKKILSSKQNLNIHLQSCLPKYEFLYKEKEEENEGLKSTIKTLENQVNELKFQNKLYKELSNNTQECIQSIAKQPKNHTTNNLILSPIDLSQEHISKVIAEKFTKEHFYDGQAGVARFAFDNILKDKDGKLAYVCTDVARHIFKHVDENGEVVKDVRASKLTKKLTADVKKMSGQIVIKKTKEEEEAKVNCSFFLTKKMEEISNIDDDNSKFRIELANLTVEK